MGSRGRFGGQERGPPIPTIGGHWDGVQSGHLGSPLPNHWESLGWVLGWPFGVRKGVPHPSIGGQWDGVWGGVLGAGRGVRIGVGNWGQQGGSPTIGSHRNGDWGGEHSGSHPQPLGGIGVGSREGIWGQELGIPPADPFPNTGVGIGCQQGGPHPSIGGQWDGVWGGVLGSGRGIPIGVGNWGQQGGVRNHWKPLGWRLGGGFGVPSPTIGGHWDGVRSGHSGSPLPNHWESLGWGLGWTFGVRKGDPTPNHWGSVGWGPGGGI